MEVATVLNFEKKGKKEYIAKCNINKILYISINYTYQDLFWVFLKKKKEIKLSISKDIQN